MQTFFKNRKELLAVLSEKEDGVMSFSIPEGEKNRLAFYAKLGISADNVVSAGLVHGSAVAVVGKTGLKRIPSKDALISRETGTYLALTIGDCLPLFLHDKKAHMVALVHAGWRSIAQNILAKTLERMESLGSAAKNIEMVVGPGIGPCHYRFNAKRIEALNEDPKDAEMFKKLSTYKDAFATTGGETAIDLRKIVKAQFIKLGGVEKNVTMSDLCTFCEAEKFFSYRREKNTPPNTMIAIIGLKR